MIQRLIFDCLFTSDNRPVCEYAIN